MSHLQPAFIAKTKNLLSSAKSLPPSPLKDSLLYQACNYDAGALWGRYYETTAQKRARRKRDHSRAVRRNKK
jgi:hypothetical protein